MGFLGLDPELVKKTGVFGLVSAEILTYVSLGYFLGRWIDEQTKMDPLFTGVLVFSGLSYSVWRIYRYVKKHMTK